MITFKDIKNYLTNNGEKDLFDAARDASKVVDSFLNTIIAKIDKNKELDGDAIKKAIETCRAEGVTDETINDTVENMVKHMEVNFDIDFPTADTDLGKKLRKNIKDVLCTEDYNLDKDAEQIQNDFQRYLKEELAREQHTSFAHKIKTVMGLLKQGFNNVSSFIASESTKKHLSDNKFMYLAGGAAVAYEVYNGGKDIEKLYAHGKQFAKVVMESETARNMLDGRLEQILDKCPAFVKNAVENYLG